MYNYTSKEEVKRNDTASKPVASFASNSSFVLTFDSTSKTESMANQMMNKTFVVLIPNVPFNNYNLTQRDYNTIRDAIDNPPDANKELQKLFHDFCRK